MVAKKVKIASAANTIVPAYLALLAKGYLVTRIGASEHEETWQALKGGDEFISEDPVSLLGLVVLYEVRGMDWKADDAEIDTFVARFP